MFSYSYSNFTTKNNNQPQKEYTLWHGYLNSQGGYQNDDTIDGFHLIQASKKKILELTNYY